MQTNGVITYVPSPWLPDAEALGREGLAVLMRHEQHALMTKPIRSLDTLVDITGPQVVLGEVRELAPVGDAVSWVREHILPSQRGAA